MKRMLLSTFTAAACLAGMLATAPTSAAQTAPSAAAKVDARFNSWLGCWRLEDDLAGTGARMCITPDQGRVRLRTLVGTNRGIDELVIPDGTPRPIVDAECKGTETSEWSNDGTRVFRTTDVTCKNESPRNIKSIAFLAPGPMWINVQHVSGDTAVPTVRAQRYRRAANQNLADGSKAAQPTSSPLAADLSWSIEDVIEASSKLPADALQAALADVRQKFNVNRKTLVSLDEAGVPGSVIDLMVALTFPHRFIVERAGGSAPIGVSTGMGWYDPFMSPLMSPFGYANCYVDNGFYGYRSYYNMCGPYMYGYNYYPYSPYLGPYSPYYGYGGGGGWVPVSGGGIDPPVINGDGRAVNGRGYTQIRERGAEPTPARASGRGDGSAAGWSGNSGGGASSGGYSGGSSGSSSGGGGSSSGGDSGRTAVARPPGGN
jgi:uncharacterized membrane protein YgcG